MIEPKENPMTGERRFRDDAYLKSCTAHGVAVSARGSELDRTVFTPRGAGRVRLLRIPGIDLQPYGGAYVRRRAGHSPADSHSGPATARVERLTRAGAVIEGIAVAGERTAPACGYTPTGSVTGWKVSSPPAGETPAGETPVAGSSTGSPGGDSVALWRCSCVGGRSRYCAPCSPLFG